MNITIKDLHDSGVHFGHQLRRYNPKSKKFVYDNRHGISIINLELTYDLLQQACAFTENLVAGGKKVLFVGTKRQAQEIVREAAQNCEMPFCVNRWMGGTLTNYATIKRSIEKYKKYLKWESDGTLEKMHNKEASAIRREMSRMNRNFEGILEMGDIPAAMFVVDVRSEAIAVAEATRMNLPVIGLVDTNSDPSPLTYPIPGNDDSMKSIRLIVETIMEAIHSGLSRREEATTSVAPKNITPLSQDTITEEQVPTIRRSKRDDAGAADVPEFYSSDNEPES